MCFIALDSPPGLPDRQTDRQTEAAPGSQTAAWPACKPAGEQQLETTSNPDCSQAALKGNRMRLAGVSVIPITSLPLRVLCVGDVRGPDIL